MGGIMPEQDFSNFKFNVNKALPSPSEHDLLFLKGNIEYVSEEIRF